MRYLIGLIAIILVLMVIPGAMAQIGDSPVPQTPGSGGFLSGNNGNMNQMQPGNQWWNGNENGFNNNQNLDQIVRILQQRGIDTRQLQDAIRSGNMALVQSILSRYQNLISSDLIFKPGPNQNNHNSGQGPNQNNHNPGQGPNQNNHNPGQGPNQNTQPQPDPKPQPNPQPR